ncbi:MAG: hypothetical protein ACYC3S_13355 [Chloroflexota bacterium]
MDVEGLRVIQGHAGNNLAGKDPWQLPVIKRAVELGLGARGPEGYQVVTAADTPQPAEAHP